MKDKILILFLTLVFIGCSHSEKKNNQNINKNNNNIYNEKNISLNNMNKEELLISNLDFKLHLENEGPSIIDAYDPFESFNRKVYYFNYEFDRWIALPSVNSYIFFLPQTARTGVTHFFSNLTEPISAINGILILDYKASLTSVGRFIINTTLGIGGLFDVASSFNLYQQKRTLNEVFAKYGVGEGPYLILPLLGPSDLRNASSQAITFLLKGPVDPTVPFTPELWQRLTLNGVNAVNFRSKVNFKYYTLGTPFEYEYVRLLYLKATEAQMSNIIDKK